MEVVSHLAHQVRSLFTDGHNQISDLVVGHAELRQELDGDVVEGLTVVLEERAAGRAELPVQIVAEAVDHVEVGGGFADGLFVLHCSKYIGTLIGRQVLLPPWSCTDSRAWPKQTLQHCPNHRTNAL